MTAPLDSRDTARRTFVEEGTAFHGTFDSSCPIVVSGSIRGSVTAPEVTIDPLGAISGAIKAERLTSSGTLSGTVNAAHVLISGSVSKDTFIRTEQLDLSLRAAQGRLQLTFGPPKPEAPAPSAEVEAAPSAEVEAAPSAEVDAGVEAEAGVEPSAEVDEVEAEADAEVEAEAGAEPVGPPSSDATPEANKSSGRRARRAQKKNGRG